MDKKILGTRITRARNARGLTQQALSEALEVDRTALARLESGTRRLEVSELLALSGALELPLAYFVAAEPETVMSRRHDALTDSGAAWELDTALHLFSRDVHELQSLGLLDVPQSVPEMRTPRTHDEAERAAETVRSVAGLGSGPVVDLGRVAEQVGLLTLVASFKGSDGGFVIVDETSPPSGSQPSTAIRHPGVAG